MITAEEKDNQYGSHYVYYRCTKKKWDQTCRQRYINLIKSLIPRQSRDLKICEPLKAVKHRELPKGRPARRTS